MTFFVAVTGLLINKLFIDILTKCDWYSFTAHMKPKSEGSQVHKRYKTEK